MILIIICSFLCMFSYFNLQIDVLGEPVFKNVIVLQTVLEEIRHRHSPAYNKLKECLSNTERHFYAFINEHHR